MYKQHLTSGNSGLKSSFEGGKHVIKVIHNILFPYNITEFKFI